MFKGAISGGAACQGIRGAALVRLFKGEEPTGDKGRGRGNGGDIEFNCCC